MCQVIQKGISEWICKEELSWFLTAILHRGLRNDFFFIFFSQFTFSNFYLDFYFPFLFGLLFLFSLFSLDFLPLLFLDFYFRLIFVLFSSYFRLIFVLFSFPLFYLDFYSIAVTFWISSKFFSSSYQFLGKLLGFFE